MNNQNLQIAIPGVGKTSVFDYYSDIDCAVGNIVKVNFRKKDLLGVVVGVEKSQLPEDKLKKIDGVVDLFSLSENQVNFIKFAANYNISSIGEILRMVMPAEIEKLEDANVDIQEYKFYSISLNNEQQNAANSILKQIHNNNYSVTLLDGVTGSGKTEVYSAAIRDVLEQKSGQVLVLMPEIMLTNQFVIRLEKLFGTRPLIWHSSVSKKMKKQYLQGIVSGKARLIISARSGLFLPFKNLQLIVVDEEHDPSYKQEDGVIYNARDMAVACCYHLKIPVILSSATPSIETLHNANIGKYFHVKLTSRYRSVQMPSLKIVDMSKEKMPKDCWISPKLKERIDYYLSIGKQSMLFLNRRGYAPLTLCKSCGHKEVCAHCSAFLVAHKKSHKLICHYCGHSKKVPEKCPECHEPDTLVFFGPGVERILDEVRAMWPNVKSLAVSRDSIDSDNGAEILNQIVSNEAQIIVGTQILSKGHHFPMLDFVGIVDADVGLFGADLRSSERTYQLLTQVSGRAGRESAGEVVLQTYYPSNPIINALVAGDREGFYKLELETRKQTGMPPFGKLIGIVVSGRDEGKLNQFLDLMNAKIKYNKECMVLGPVPAPISYLKGRYRYRFLVKSESLRPQAYVDSWINSLKVPNSIRIKIDVDPYGLM